MSHFPLNPQDAPPSINPTDEVPTSSSQEFTEEVLQHLLEFSTELEGLSRKAADGIGDLDSYIDLIRLIDEITIFTEGITAMKRLLKLGLLQSINLLEADLLSILKDLLTFQENGQKEYVTDLLRTHLPANLAQWREVGIPALIRSRDC